MQLQALREQLFRQQAERLDVARQGRYPFTSAFCFDVAGFADFVTKMYCSGTGQHQSITIGPTRDAACKRQV